MTKLEEKLIELGYELQIKEDSIIGTKSINYNTIVVIGIYENKINSNYVYMYPTHIRKQDTIDNLQQAFNEMQNDLAILKEVLENE